MTATKAPPQAAAPRAGRAATPRPLLGMYILVGTVLCCVAACAGQIMFQGDLNLSAGSTGVINQCATKFPVAGTLENVRAFDRCAAGATRVEGYFILGAIAAFLVAAATLSVVVPWAELRRLRRAVPVEEIPGVMARFASLCAEAGLRGRRIPRLQVVGAGRPVVRQAFTTAPPWGRPLVVLPAKVAVSRQDPRRFDPVVLHELAHVRARDVSWVSSVRGVTWLTIPVIVLACVPGFLNSQGTRIADTVLIQAGLFVVITAAFAAGLLRLRELEADRQAASWLGSGEPLGRVLSAGVPQSRRGWRRIAGALRRPLDRHPSVSARIDALHGVLGTTDTDFAFPLAVGAVAALAMNTAYYLTSIFDFGGGGWPPTRASAAVGSIVLGTGLTPGLIRRAVVAHRAGKVVSWWRPVTGTAAGLLLGLLVPPSTLPGPDLAVVSGQGLGYTAVKVLLLVLAGAGTAALTAGIASLVAAGEPYRGGMWLTAWVSLAVSCTAAAALWPIVNLATGEIERVFLTTSLPAIQWRWLALPYPATGLLLGVRLRLPRARNLLAPLAVPVCAALIGTTIFLPHSLVRRGAGPDIFLRVGSERWWLCTLIGWIVLAVLALSGGVPGLARAWVSAWLATLLAGTELIIYGAFHGHRPDLAALSLAVATPSVWLFYLGIPTACLALLRIRPPAAPRPRWLAPIGTSMGAVAVALTVIGLASPLDSLTFYHPSLRAPVTQPTPVLVAVDPGRVLTTAAARQVISGVSAALSPLWTAQTTGATSAASAHGAHPPAINPGACEPLARLGFASSLPTALADATGQYKAVPEVVPVGNATLSIYVYSYARPVPAAVFTTASNELRACHRYTVTTLNGVLTYTVHEVAPPHIGSLSLQVNYSVMYKHQDTSLTWIFTAIGHNLIVLTQQTVAFGTLLPLQQTAITTALNTATYGLSHTPHLPHS
jgi:Zn-dependent protease with chaperone function